MIRKGQMDRPAGSTVSAADQFYSLAAGKRGQRNGFSRPCLTNATEPIFSPYELGATSQAGLHPLTTGLIEQMYC